MQCSARRKSDGSQCTRRAIAGARVCLVHGGGAPQVKRSARARILELVDPALGTLARAVAPRKGIPNAQEISAAKDILDRAGFKPVEKTEVNVTLMEALRHGDISRLDDEALSQLTAVVERLAFGEERARMMEEKRRVLIEAGAGPDVIEAEFAEVEEPGSKDSLPTEDDDGW